MTKVKVLFPYQHYPFTDLQSQRSSWVLISVHATDYFSLSDNLSLHHIMYIILLCWNQSFEKFILTSVCLYTHTHTHTHTHIYIYMYICNSILWQVPEITMCRNLLLFPHLPFKSFYKASLVIMTKFYYFLKSADF